MSFLKASSPPLPPRTGIAEPMRSSLMGLENRNHTHSFLTQSGVFQVAERLQSLYLVVSGHAASHLSFSAVGAVTTVDSEKAWCLRKKHRGGGNKQWRGQGKAGCLQNKGRRKIGVRSLVWKGMPFIWLTVVHMVLIKPIWRRCWWFKVLIVRVPVSGVPPPPLNRAHGVRAETHTQGFQLASSSEINPGQGNK